jgi:acetate---CoA ligase (ADP-forming)
MTSPRDAQDVEGAAQGAPTTGDLGDTPPARDLTPLFDPRSVAVVGASSDTSKWGGDVSARLLRAELRRPVYFVNGKGGEVLGRPAYASLRDLPEAPELVILAMSAKLLEGVVDDCIALGVGAVVCVTAMLGEMGPQGKVRELAAARRLREAGSLLLGPNCMGVADTATGLEAVAYVEVQTGTIGLISQSGGFGEELNERLKESHLGFSRFVAVGNQADVGVADVLRSFVAHRPTRAVVVYAEELRDGRDFVQAAAALVASGTPVVLVAPGRCEASSRVARTHTGSLTSDAVTVDAACRAAGVLRANTQREAVELLVALLTGKRPRGRRVAVISDGGGTSAIVADLCAIAGLAVPQLRDTTQTQLREALAVNAGCSNPIDFAAATYDPEAYERAVDIVLAADEADAILASGVIGFWGDRFPEQTEMVAKEAASLARMADKVSAGRVPLLASTPQQCAAVDDLRRRGLPVYRDVESSVNVLARLTEAAERPASGLLPLPAAAAPVTSEGYWEARRVLAAAELPLVPARPLQTDEEALQAAAELGYPVALKAAALLHKSDAGGVELGLADAASLSAALARFRQRFGGASPFALEAMAPLAEGVELIIGCRWDARFGPLLLVGMGGVLTELFGDVRAALAPVSEASAARLIRELRGAALLSGVRGRPPLDIDAAAQAAAALSRFAAAHPEIESAEINPLLVLPQGALGLDARLVLIGDGPAPGASPVADTGRTL